MRNIFFFLSLLFFFLISCAEKKKTTAEDKASKSLELMAYDRSFSQMSESKGMKAAFIEFMDSNSVLLRPDQFPITGANAIDYLVLQNDTEYKLTWDPEHADVAESGDLGFTYGIYMMQPASKDTLYYGTYTHIWRKQNDGKWKLVLNSTNEGVDESNEKISNQ